MKRVLMVAAVAAVWSTGAFAWCASGYTEETCGSLHVCYQGTAPACPSTDPSTTNTNTNGNTNTNSNQQSQNQGQSQGQGQSQSSNNSNKNSNKNTANGGTGVGVGYGGSSNSTSYAGSNATGGNATGGAGGQGGQGGGGGSASTDSHAVTTQAQTANGGKASVTGSGNGGVSDVNVGGDTYEAQARNPVNTAYAAPVTVVQSDSCRTGVAAGGQAIAFGFTFSGTQQDENCERIKLWRELRGAGFMEEAKELLKQDDRVAKAFAAADGHRGKTAAIQLRPLKNNEYEGRDLSVNEYR